MPTTSKGLHGLGAHQPSTSVQYVGAAERRSRCISGSTCGKVQPGHCVISAAFKREPRRMSQEGGSCCWRMQLGVEGEAEADSWLREEECGTGAIHIGRIVNLEAKQRGNGVWGEGRCCLSIHVCSVRWMQHGLWHLCRHKCQDSETRKVWEAVRNIEDVTENRGSRGGFGACAGMVLTIYDAHHICPTAAPPASLHTHVSSSALSVGADHPHQSALLQVVIAGTTSFYDLPAATALT
ncbi:hypothetical protein HaLaN_18160 [Haematococcus lacustris]|uniref:Uncharacterized protein n=1 Tax=Haematococcus lacustris TaxID=44745 RepID=A0A699ZFI4_HAELA|nr:hypothetical protein HaLaN_18160 [Haematococcus lacustris]